MIFQLQNLDRFSALSLPENCRRCGWWQGHDGGWPSAPEANAWAEAAEESFGAWGKLALGDGRLLGMIQYGPARLFPRARQLPGGPASEDAVLLACGVVADEVLGTVQRGLLTAILAELKQRRVETVEAFGMETENGQYACHFFSAGFLRDCGFSQVRSARRLKLMRLELGGSQPAPVRKPRLGILRRIKSRSAAPVPAALAVPLPLRSFPYPHGRTTLVPCCRDG